MVLRNWCSQMGIFGVTPGYALPWMYLVVLALLLLVDYYTILQGECDESDQIRSALVSSLTSQILLLLSFAVCLPVCNTEKVVIIPHMGVQFHTRNVFGMEHSQVR